MKNNNNHKIKWQLTSRLNVRVIFRGDVGCRELPEGWNYSVLADIFQVVLQSHEGETFQVFNSNWKPRFCDVSSVFTVDSENCWNPVGLKDHIWLTDCDLCFKRAKYSFCVYELKSKKVESDRLHACSHKAMGWTPSVVKGIRQWYFSYRPPSDLWVYLFCPLLRPR